MTHRLMFIVLYLLYNICYIHGQYHFGSALRGIYLRKKNQF